VHGDVIGHIAFDFILRFVGAGVVRVGFEHHIPRMHLDDVTPDAAGLGVPAYVVADFVSLCHPRSHRTQWEGGGW